MRSPAFGVVSALQDAAAREGAGATASHLICGHHALHDALEREMADWSYRGPLLFGQARRHHAAVPRHCPRGGCLVRRPTPQPAWSSRLPAACAATRRYAAWRSRPRRPRAAMLATDGVFSMDGDIAPLRSLSLVARMQEALLYVDDAHGIGMVGEHGRGCVAEAGLGVNDVPLQLATLGKALGGSGAVVLGDEAMIQHLAETARPYIYTTAVPPAQAAAALAAVKLARRDDWRREPPSPRSAASFPTPPPV
ncbi:aminotransferase class I/II-fold pyridoxal phosphate-dependent enzyme [Streptomyces sp. II-2-2-2]